MNVIEAIEKRRTIRAFLPEAVPKATLEIILTKATRAPSWSDAQPWKIAVAGGEVLENIRKEYLEAFDRGEVLTAEIERPKEWPEALKDRQLHNRTLLNQTMGISSNDTESAKAYVRTMHEFYGAPVVVFLLKDMALTPWTLFDMGLLSENIMLAAEEFGLASSVAVTFVNYPRILRKHLSIPENDQFVLGIALGYKKPDQAVNRHQSPRVALKEVCNLYGI